MNCISAFHVPNLDLNCRLANQKKMIYWKSESVKKLFFDIYELLFAIKLLEV